jgi:hypothetical protein
MASVNLSLQNVSKLPSSVGGSELRGEETYMASANFFSVKSLLPSALSASAMM